MLLYGARGEKCSLDTMPDYTIFAAATGKRPVSTRTMRV